MGISNYKEWLLKYYKNAFNKVDITKTHVYDHVYIDLNHYLHSSCYNIVSKKGFFVRLFRSLKYILMRIIPRKSINIGIDGSSPFMKIILQRKRRMEMIYNKKELSSLELTPGTEFMDEINQEIRIFMEKWKKNYKMNDIKININDSTNAGEGEIKVFQQLKENGKINLMDTHIVIGNDADLIVLAMASYPIKFIDILIRNENSYCIIKMETLINEHLKLLNSNTYSYNLRNEFVLLSIMMGNDYIKKLNYVDPLKMCDEYINLRKEISKGSDYGLVVNNEINYDFLKLFMIKLNNILPSQYNKLKYYDYDKDMIESYFKTLKWSWNLYNTGECSMIDYCTYYETSPSPIQIIYYIDLNKNINIPLPISLYKPINSKYIPLLVFNPQSSELVQKKLRVLYDTKMKYLEFDLDEYEKIKKEYNDIHLKAKQYKEENKTKKLSNQLKKSINLVKEKLKKNRNNIPKFGEKEIKEIVKYAEEL
jgi:hypothetical protein